MRRPEPTTDRCALNTAETQSWPNPTNLCRTPAKFGRTQRGAPFGITRRASQRRGRSYEAACLGQTESETPPHRQVSAPDNMRTMLVKLCYATCVSPTVRNNPCKALCVNHWPMLSKNRWSTLLQIIQSCLVQGDGGKGVGEVRVENNSGTNLGHTGVPRNTPMTNFQAISAQISERVSLGRCGGKSSPSN